HGHTLEMVADVGAYADAIREVRANIDSTDRSLCGEAFVRGDSRMVNNPPQDSVYSDFCERYRDLSKEDEKIKRLLSAVTFAGCCVCSRPGISTQACGLKFSESFKSPDRMSVSLGRKFQKIYFACTIWLAARRMGTGCLLWKA